MRRTALHISALAAALLLCSTAAAQTLAWSHEPASLLPHMPGGIQMNGTAVVETDGGVFVYIIGGNKSTGAGGETTRIHFALLRDGRPGTFREATARLEGGGTSYHTRSTVSFNGRIYVVGGRLNMEGEYTTPYNGIRVYEPDASGDIPEANVAYYTGEGLGAHPAVEPPLDLLEMAAVVAPSRARPGMGVLYILGGGIGDTETGAVRMARIAGLDGTIEGAGPDGELAGALEELEPLPAPTAFHAAVLHEGRIYVTGNNPPSETVLFSEILDDDTLGPWRTVSAPLPEGRLDPAAASFGGELYVLGGTAGTNADTRNTVFRAVFGGDGDVVGWAEDAPVPLEPGFRRVGATVTRDSLLIIGGRRSSDGFTPEVQVGRRAE